MNQQSQTWIVQQAIQERCFHPSGEWEEFPKSAVEGSITARFAEMVARYPDRPAVKVDEEMLTYVELNAAANRVAHAILAQRGEGAEPVAFLIEQGVRAIITMLGILKTGKFYVALEPTHPPARLQTILADTEAHLLITNGRQVGLAGQIIAGNQSLLNVDQLAQDLATTDPEIAITPDAIAYLVYTSGTTGIPKGVIETHRNVLHYTRVYSNFYHVCQYDRIGTTGANSFSGTPAHMMRALLNGAAILPFDITVQSITALSQWLMAEAITQFVAVTSVLRQLITTADRTAHFPCLRLLGTGGDRTTPADIALYQQHFAPHCIFRTTLALSEIKVVTHYFIDHATPIPATHVPAGFCVEETEVFLIDEKGQLLGPGVVGEIVVKSRYTSPGYWRRPELTAARFRPDPEHSEQRLFYTGDLGLLHPDGCLIHMGRKDQQVKIRGVRVETAEIEAALWAFGGLKEVVVTAQPDAHGEAQLVAYLVPTTNPAPTVTALRRYLEPTLPAAMIPAAFIFLDALPLNANGKVDLRSLPAPDHNRPVLDVPYVAPRTPLEETLVTIWQEVLAVEPVGIEDRFLDLGGNSLRAMQVHARLIDQLQEDLPLHLLFERATVAELALVLTQRQAAQLLPEEVAQLLTALEATESGGGRRS